MDQEEELINDEPIVEGLTTEELINIQILSNVLLNSSFEKIKKGN